MCQILINGREKVEFTERKSQKSTNDDSQTNDNVQEHLDDYNATKKMKPLIAFNNIIPDMEAKKNIKSCSY